MSKFKEVTYDPLKSIARIGAGNIWDEVYAKITHHNVNVVGGRIQGVGVGGFLLGGGYGWTTQQHGLAIDTIIAYDLVTPTGNILNVTASNYPDLFWALKGGGNNFGIVTTFTMKTHAQTKVYGGHIFYNKHIDRVTEAIAEFDENNSDPKAAIIPTYAATPVGFEIILYIFYDHPLPPRDTFKIFLDIPAKAKNLRTRTFPKLIHSLGSVPRPPRLVSQTVPIIQYTKPILDEIVKQTKELARAAEGVDLGIYAALTVEPFMRNTHQHAQGGAYPHSQEHPWTPLQMLIGYVNPLEDKRTASLITKGANSIHAVAIRENQSSADAILYNNYAQQGTDLSLLYGENLQKLRELRARYDPDNIINLTGGWKL
ncbi:hypothetical protein M422DRAFT_28117 [Sphaerobolus stellatus SS14]|nr:hypothetical protein M422DRAFT_28117 [Sphaerobolus stellatus SS14]